MAFALLFISSLQSNPPVISTAQFLSNARLNISSLFPTISRLLFSRYRSATSGVIAPIIKLFRYLCSPSLPARRLPSTMFRASAKVRLLISFSSSVLRRTVPILGIEDTNPSASAALIALYAVPSLTSILSATDLTEIRAPTSNDLMYSIILLCFVIFSTPS